MIKIQIVILQLVHIGCIKKINARLQKVREGRYNGISEYDTIDINKIHK